MQNELCTTQHIALRARQNILQNVWHSFQELTRHSCSTKRLLRNNGSRALVIDVKVPTRVL